MESPFEEFVKNTAAMRNLQFDDDLPSLRVNCPLAIFEKYDLLKNYVSKHSVIDCLKVDTLTNLHEVINGYAKISKFSFGMGIDEFKRLKNELKESCEKNAKDIVKQVNQHHDEAAWRYRRSLMYQKNETWDTLSKLVDKDLSKKAELEKIKQNWEVHAHLAHCTSHDLVFMSKSLQSIEVYIENSLPLLEEALKSKKTKFTTCEFYKDYYVYLKQLKISVQQEREKLVHSIMARLALSANHSDANNDDLIWCLERQLLDMGIFNKSHIEEISQQAIRKTLTEDTFNYFIHYLSNNIENSNHQMSFLVWKLPEDDQFKMNWVKIDRLSTFLPESIFLSLKDQSLNFEERKYLANSYAFVKLQIIFNAYFNKIQAGYLEYANEFNHLEILNTIVSCIEILSQEYGRVQKALSGSVQIKQVLEAWSLRLVHRQQMLLQQSLKVVKDTIENNLTKLVNKNLDYHLLKKIISHFNLPTIRGIILKLDNFQSFLPQDDTASQYKSEMNQLLANLYDYSISLQSQLVRCFLSYFLQPKSKNLYAHRIENGEVIYLPEPDQLLFLAADVRSFLTPPNQESLDILTAVCLGKKQLSASEFGRHLAVLGMTCQWDSKECQLVQGAIVEQYLMKQLHSPFSWAFHLLKEIKGIAWSKTWERQFYSTLQNILNNIRRVFEQGLYEYGQESYRNLNLTLPSVKEKEIQLFHEGILKLKALRPQSPGHWNLLLSSVDQFLQKYDGKTTLFHPLIEALADEEHLYDYAKKRFSYLLNTEQDQIKRDALLLQHSKTNPKLNDFIQQEFRNRLIPSFCQAKYSLDQKIRFLSEKDLFSMMILFADKETLSLFYQMSDSLFMSYIKRLFALPPNEELVNKARQWLSQLSDKKMTFPSALGKNTLSDLLIKQTQFGWNPIVHLVINHFGDRQTREVYALKWVEVILFEPNMAYLIKDDSEGFIELVWGYLSIEGQQHFCKLIHHYLDQFVLQFFSGQFSEVIFEWLEQKITRLTFDHDGLLIREKIKDRFDEASSLLQEFKCGYKDAQLIIEKIQSRQFESAYRHLNRIKDDWWVASQSLDTSWRERSLYTLHARIKPLIDLTSPSHSLKEHQQVMDEFLDFYDSKHQPHPDVGSLNQSFKQTHQAWKDYAQSTQSWLACRLLDQMKSEKGCTKYPHYLKNNLKNKVLISPDMDVSFHLNQKDQQSLQEIGDLYHAYTQNIVKGTCLDWRIDSSIITHEQVQDELKAIENAGYPIVVLLSDRLIQELKKQSSGQGLSNRWNLFLLLHLRQIFSGTNKDICAKIESWANYVKALVKANIFSFDDLDLEKRQTALLEDVSVFLEQAKKLTSEQKPGIQELQNLIAQIKNGLDHYIHQLARLENINTPLLKDLELLGEVTPTVQNSQIDVLMQSSLLKSILNLPAVQSLFNLGNIEESSSNLTAENHDKRHLIEAINHCARMINELIQIQNQLSSTQHQFTKTCKQSLASILSEIEKVIPLLIIELTMSGDVCEMLQSVQSTIVQFKKSYSIENSCVIPKNETVQISDRFPSLFFSHKKCQPNTNTYSKNQVKSVIETIVKITFENLSLHQRNGYEQSDVSIITEGLYRSCHNYLAAFCDPVFFHQHISEFIKKLSCVAHAFIEEKSLFSKTVYMFTNYNPYALLTSRKYIFVQPKLKDHLEKEELSTMHNHAVFLQQRIGEIGLGVCKKFKELVDYQSQYQDLPDESSINFTEMKRAL